MNAADLKVGDYVIIQFNPDITPQLAEIVSIDHENQIARILPESQKDTIRIQYDDQWKQICACPLLYQVLKAFGFDEITLKKAYGWTAKQWTKVSYNGKYIFDLSYNENTWSLDVSWLEGEEPKSKTHENIRYLHELQQILRIYSC